MSPEQIRGETADVRSDLWALGVVLYEMLIARKPFGGDQDIAIAHAILNDQPAPLALERLDVSAALEDIVLKLLSKDPAGRYATTRELLSELARIDIAPGTASDLRTRVRRVRRSISPRQKRMMAAFGAIAASGFLCGQRFIEMHLP
jgi:serine/threonine-protein kinase